MDITLKMVQNGFLVSALHTNRFPAFAQTNEVGLEQFQTRCDSSQMSTLAERYTNISRAKSGKGVTMMTMPLVSTQGECQSKTTVDTAGLTSIIISICRRRSTPD